MNKQSDLETSWVLDSALRPNPQTVQGLLADLLNRYGTARTANLIGVHPSTFRACLVQRRRRMPGGWTRSIFYVHCLTFTPWKLRSAFDLLTWGRFADEPPPELPGEKTA